MYYTKEGYLDFEQLLKADNSTYKFIVGGRGIGKTFGILKYMIEHKIKFIFMRRTQTQVDMIKSDELNPFKALYSVLGKDWLFNVENINKNISAVYKTVYVPEDNIYKSTGSPLAYIMALSTVSNIRGFDASDVDYLVYDEFIGEKHEKAIAGEGTAFLNAIETIARNRELQGRQPMKVISMSNSTNLANPIFIQLKIITACEKLMKQGKDRLVLKDRDLSIYFLHNSPISKQKANTSLYKLSGKDSDFTKMSLDNQFNREYFGQVKHRKLSEFKALVVVGEIVIYRHKSRMEWYVTDHLSGHPDETYESSEIELKRFRHDYYYLKLAYLNRHVFFESYIQQVLFEQYIH